MSITGSGGTAQEGRALAERLGASALTLTVLDSATLTPAMRRLRLGGADLEGLEHRPGQDLMVAVPDAARAGDGVTYRRRYTIRRLDPVAASVDLDIVVHGDGPGARWATTAAPGDEVAAIGPRGKVTVVDGAAWHLFAGDESALPGVAAMVESLEPGRMAVALLEVDGPLEHQTVVPPAGVELHLRWLDRNGAEPGTGTALADALASVALPPGTGHAYLAGELRVVAALRSTLLDRGLSPDQLSPKPYWRRGTANAAHGEPDRD